MGFVLYVYVGEICGDFRTGESQSSIWQSLGERLVGIVPGKDFPSAPRTLHDLH